MKIAIVLGDMETLAPRALCREDFQTVFGAEFVLFDPSWADLDPESLYNSDLILAGNEFLARAAGLAMQCEFLSDQVPVIVLPAYSGDTAEIELISSFLKNVRLGANADSLDVVLMCLKSNAQTDVDRAKLEQLGQAISVDGVRFGDPILAIERFDTDETPYLTNGLIRDVATSLRQALTAKGVTMSAEMSELKVMRPLRKLTQEGMSIDQGNVDIFAQAIADTILLQVLQNSNRK